MMTRHNIFHVIQTAVLNRLLLIIIALMIASPFVVLPIKGCTTSGSQTGSAPMEISAPPETS